MESKSIKIKDISKIATVIKSAYKKTYLDMHFLFSYRMEEDKFFIFQDIQGLPIYRWVYSKSTNSLSIVSSWSSNINPNALVEDANNEVIKDWEYLLKESNPYNNKANKIGVLNKNEWVSVCRGNKNNTQEPQDKVKKVNTFFEFRMVDLTKANFYTWGFELYSPTMALVAIKDKFLFPYGVSGNEYSLQDLGIVEQSEIVNMVFSIKNLANLKWIGRFFDISVPSQMQNFMNATNVGVVGLDHNLLSFWVKEDTEEDIANDEFYEEMTNLEQKENKKDILDIGQRKIDLYFD